MTTEDNWNPTPPTFRFIQKREYLRIGDVYLDSAGGLHLLPDPGRRNIIRPVQFAGKPFPTGWIRLVKPNRNKQ